MFTMIKDKHFHMRMSEDDLAKLEALKERTGMGKYAKTIWLAIEFTYEHAHILDYWLDSKDE